MWKLGFCQIQPFLDCVRNKDISLDFHLRSSRCLTDISKSIQSYLRDDDTQHLILAIDLCARGFSTWQQYIDAMEMLRSLLSLATTSKKESISSENASPQARLAVLQIASSNTHLFMTTLTLDIVNPTSTEHRKSVLQIVAFLIRKVKEYIIASWPVINKLHRNLWYYLQICRG